MKRLALIAALVTLAACTDEPKALRVLQSNGYTDIKLTGYDPFGCDKHDNFATGFQARSPNGQFVTGVVCSGWMKGATIRFD